MGSMMKALPLKYIEREPPFYVNDHEKKDDFELDALKISLLNPLENKRIRNNFTMGLRGIISGFAIFLQILGWSITLTLLGWNNPYFYSFGICMVVFVSADILFLGGTYCLQRSIKSALESHGYKECM